MPDPSSIVFVTTELAPYTPGGAGAVVAELVERLGGRVVLVGHDGPGLPHWIRAVPVPEPDDESLGPFLARSRAAARALSELDTPPTLVEFQDFEGLAYWSLAHREELGLSRVPLTIRLHGPVDLMEEAMGVGHPEWRAVVIMEQEAFRMADRVVVPSEPFRSIVAERYGVEAERIAVSPPPIPDIPPVGWQPSGVPELVCLGRLGEVKGSHDFLRAALDVLEAGHEISFRFVGEDGWSVEAGRSMRPWLEDMTPERHRDRITFQGRVPLDRLPGVLATAWAVVIPSRFESFSLAAHQVRRMGLPVVLSDLPAFRSYFTAQTGALIYDRTTSGLARAMTDLLDPALREELAARPAPQVDDPLTAYRDLTVEVHHPRTQAGLATAAQKRLEQALVDGSEAPSRLAMAARAFLRMLPSPVARLAVRLVPQRVKDRFRKLANWAEEAERRAALTRREAFRERIEAGEFSDLAEPEVSVVIPCYNQGAFLEEALMSVFEQEMGSFEVIVVDDGSTDPDTVRMLESLSLPRVTVIRQENRGLPAARNAGMKEARGEFLVPLDADDQLAPRFLAELRSSLEDKPRAAYAHCWARLFGDQDAYWMSRPFNPYQLFLSNSVVGCVLLRREAWAAVGGYAEDMTAGNEDWDLWLRLQTAGWEQVEVRRPLFWYRKHGVSMSVGTEARYEVARRQMAVRHPDLYRLDDLVAVKRRWYPWVSVIVGSEADLDTLGHQSLDDLELIALGPPESGLAELAHKRAWQLREGGAELAETVRVARGKFLIEWDLIDRAGPDAVLEAAVLLEETPRAAGVGTAHGPILWRRWAVLDPDSSHQPPVEAEIDWQGARSDLRGRFPTEGWAIVLHFPDPDLPVQRQEPEEEGRIPDWLIATVASGERGA